MEIFIEDYRGFPVSDKNRDMNMFVTKITLDPEDLSISFREVDFEEARYLASSKRAAQKGG